MTDKASPFRVVKTVVSGFFGLRKRAEFEKDVATLTLKQVVIAGFLLMLVFVSTLVLIVRAIVG
jgi:hypothetical protein